MPTQKLNGIIQDLTEVYVGFLNDLEVIDKKYHEKIITYGKYKINKTITDGFILTNSVLNKIKKIKTGKMLLSGTPKTTGKILGWYYLDNSKDVYRFSHGGCEWGFFEDYHNGFHEFVNCTKYYMHSKKEAESFIRRIKDDKLADNMSGNKVIFDTNRSQKYKNIIESCKIKTKTTDKRLIYVTTAYIGDEIPMYPSMKLEESKYLEWQIWLLESLKKRGWEVKTKIHPKGTFDQGGFLEQFCSGVIRGRFDPRTNDAIQDNVCHLFDMVGTAFGESLAFSADTILIHDGLRTFDAESKKAIETRCKIIDNYVDENGKYRVDLDKLEKLLLSKPLELTDEFVENYF